MTEFSLDPNLYTRTLNLDVPSTVALGHQLAAAALATPPPPTKRALTKLIKVTDELAIAYADSQHSGQPSDPRPIDMRADRAWGAVEGSLHYHTLLPADEYRHVSRAAKLYEDLFPDGLKFTQLEYGAQWTESEWRIQRIVSEGLEPELRKLCGDIFIQELFKSHRAYGQMTGTTRARRETPVFANLAELRRRVQQATVAYAVQLVALHMEGDEAERAAVQTALRPFDAYRERILSDLAAANRAKEPSAPPPPAPPPSSSAPSSLPA